MAALRPGAWASPARSRAHAHRRGVGGARAGPPPRLPSLLLRRGPTATPSTLLPPHLPVTLLGGPRLPLSRSAIHTLRSPLLVIHTLPLNRPQLPRTPYPSSLSSHPPCQTHLPRYPPPVLPTLLPSSHPKMSLLSRGRSFIPREHSRVSAFLDGTGPRGAFLAKNRNV